MVVVNRRPEDGKYRYRARDSPGKGFVEEPEGVGKHPREKNPGTNAGESLGLMPGL